MSGPIVVRTDCRQDRSSCPAWDAALGEFAPPPSDLLAKIQHAGMPLSPWAAEMQREVFQGVIPQTGAAPETGSLHRGGRG